MYNKKAQITIFTIIGLLIVLGGIVFFYTTQNAPKPLEPEIKIIQEQVPVELDPIKKFANDCTYSVAVEGLKIIGEQGGYISFTDRTLNRESFAITNSPTESDVVSFTRNSDLKIPYWWYLKSANDCKNGCAFASKKPELRQSDNSIEKQLERYIDAKFSECTKNFDDFKRQAFKITEQGKIKTDVIITPNDIVVLVDYPLSVEKQDVKTKISQFLARVPINLDKIYDLATKITNLEIKHRYLEKHILNLLVAFSGKDRNKLPPMSDMSFEFGSTMSWQKSEIKNKVIGLLSSYVPLFQVDGTYNYERNFFDSELKQRLYDSTIIPVANSSFSNLAAYFTYLDFWQAYFDLNCNGERCIPSSANSIISFFGIQTYRFAYDLSFPVLVEVKDPFALNDRGYTFNFFLEANIRNNKAMPANFTPLQTGALSERSQLCDVRTSGDIKVKVSESGTSKPIKDANVLYTLIGESCYIGLTGADGTLTEKFPVGIGGYVNIVKDGYIGKVAEFDPKPDASDTININVQPIYTKKLIVKKKNVVKTPQGWQFVDMPLELNAKEYASITLNRLKEENELDFPSIANYEGQQEGQQKEPSEIELAPGTYVADVTLVLNEKIVIPEKEKCEGTIIEECYTVPKVEFGDNFPEGGLKTNITITPNDLSKGTIMLYVVSIDLASVPEQQRVIEDLDQIDKIEEYSNTHKSALQPIFQ